MSGQPDHSAKKPKVNLDQYVGAAASDMFDLDTDNDNSDPSGAEHREHDETATAILKKKKKPNSLMYVQSRTLRSPELNLT